MDIVLTNKYKDMNNLINRILSPISRREIEHKRDSSMQHVVLRSNYIVKVHRNRVTNNKDMKNCEYLRGMYRYAEGLHKRIR